MDEAVQKERRIWWIDKSLVVVYFLLNLWIMRQSFGSFFPDAIWIYPVATFIYLFFLCISYVGLRTLLDKVFHTGRSFVFLATLKALAIISLVMTVVTCLLIFAASKTADLLF